MKIEIEDVKLYVTLQDYTVSDTLPILCFAKCIDDIGILIPDWTFHFPYKSQIKKTGRIKPK